MITKTYRTATIAEAVDQIKREMGPRAQILSTRRITGRGILPWKKTHTMQITAHVEERFVSPDQLEALQAMRGVVFTKDDDVKDGVPPVVTNLSLRTQSHAYEQRILQMQTLIDDLKKQIESMKLSQDEIAFIQTSLSAAGPVAEMGEARLEMAEFLARQGFSDEDLDSWNQLILRMSARTDANSVLEKTAEWMLGRVQTTSPGAWPRALIIGGEANSGCTTVMLKCASRVVRGGGRVVLVCAGNPTYRAKRLVRSCGAKWRSPVVIASDPEQLAESLRGVATDATILVDAGGECPDPWRNGLAAMTSQDVQVWQSLHCGRVRDGVPPIGAADALVLTYLDQATFLGRVISFLGRSRVPAAFFSVGENIDNDLEEATPERLAGLLFRLDEGEESQDNHADEVAVH